MLSSVNRLCEEHLICLRHTLSSLHLYYTILVSESGVAILTYTGAPEEMVS